LGKRGRFAKVSIFVIARRYDALYKQCCDGIAQAMSFFEGRSAHRTLKRFP